MINVTKSYLPDFNKYADRLKLIWESHWLTNNGPMVIELEGKIKNYIGNEHILFTNNGTIVLQMALKALNITKEVITTPFSYVATTNALLWEKCTPVFVDINNTDFNINVDLIESKITPDTEAILATHVFGNPCNVEALQKIADKHNLKLIYDAAHVFGAGYKGKSLLTYGDISTCSFHSTKVFHTVEGGAIFAKDKAVFDKLYLYRQFGHVGDDYYDIGVNGKASEFHAAMGLCVLEDLSEIIAQRKKATELYDELLDMNKLQRPIALPDTLCNYAYYPVVFESEEILLKVKTALQEQQIFARRYFYPSLNQLPYIKESYSCPVSESISSRILSLPLSSYISEEEIIGISKTINDIIR